MKKAAGRPTKHMHRAKAGSYRSNRIPLLIVPLCLLIFVCCGGGGEGDGGTGASPPPTTPQWVGIKQVSSSTWDQGYSIASDKNGNIYLAGDTQGVIDNNAPNGLTDIFLCKYTPSGDRLWTKYYGATSEAHAYKLIIDGSDFLYIVGSAYGSFNGLIDSGSGDALIIKLDSNGDMIWATQFGTSANDRLFEIALDASNNIFVAGATSGSFSGNTNVGNDDVFFAQLNSSGDPNWIVQFGSPQSDYPTGIILDGINGVFIAGRTIPASPIVGSGSIGDSFLAKFSTFGVFQFIQQYSMGEFVGLARDSFNNLYTTISNASTRFIVKLGSGGNVIWEKSIISTSQQGRAIFVKNDHIYITGHSRGPLYTNVWNGEADYIILRYDIDGNVLMAIQHGTDVDDFANDIFIDDSENIFIGGTTAGSFPGNTNLGSYDAFIAKYDRNGVLQ